jgi:hypothetical protein
LIGCSGGLERAGAGAEDPSHGGGDLGGGEPFDHGAVVGGALGEQSHDVVLVMGPEIVPR